MTRAQRFLTNKEINVLIDLYLYCTFVVGERVQKSKITKKLSHFMSRSRKGKRQYGQRWSSIYFRNISFQLQHILLFGPDVVEWFELNLNRIGPVIKLNATATKATI